MALRRTPSPSSFGGKNSSEVAGNPPKEGLVRLERNDAQGLHQPQLAYRSTAASTPTGGGVLVVWGPRGGWVGREAAEKLISLSICQSFVASYLTAFPFSLRLLGVRAGFLLIDSKDLFFTQKRDFA